MRLFNNKQLLLRIIAASAEAILFYIGFLFVNQVVDGSRINIIFFVIIALCGLLVNFLPYNSVDKNKHSLVFGSIGLALAVLSIGISAIKGFSLYALPVSFIALIFLYYRSYTSYLSNIIYLYTAGTFYKSIGFLFVINGAAAFFGESFTVISDELMRYSILYIIIALYVLSEVKNFRYINKNENSRKTAFDIAATSLMIIITVIMSIPKVFKIVIFPFVAVFQFLYGWIVKGILLITYPFALLLNYLYGLVPEVDQEGALGNTFKNMLGMKDKYDKDLTDINSPLVELIGKALTFVFLMLICAYGIYLLFKFINRITRSEEEEDFVEDKEFVLGSNKQKSPGLFNKLADSMKKAADNITFMFMADNRDKLRNEYKIFTQKLYNKKIIDNDKYTAQDILKLMLSKTSGQRDLLTSITDMYEEVRYGARYPEDLELKSFRKNLAEISKNLQQMQ